MISVRLIKRWWVGVGYVREVSWMVVWRIGCFDKGHITIDVYVVYCFSEWKLKFTSSQK